MADHTEENNNVANVNNNVSDHNTEVNNAGPAGLNADNNNDHADDMCGPSEYRDGLTSSSSSLSRWLKECRRPLQNYQPPAF